MQVLIIFIMAIVREQYKWLLMYMNFEVSAKYSGTSL